MVRATTMRVPWLHSERQSELEAYLWVADRMNTETDMSPKQQTMGLGLLHRFVCECRTTASAIPEPLEVSDLAAVTFDQAVQAWKRLRLDAQWSPVYTQRVRTILSQTLEAINQPRLAFAINRNRLQRKHAM